jgi:membrane-associated phospholipid phosphatase
VTGVQTCALPISLELCPVAVAGPDAERSPAQTSSDGPAGQTPGPGTDGQSYRWRFLLSGLAGTNSSTGEEPAEGRNSLILPWTGLPGNALAMFSGSRAVLHLSALAGTLLIVESGLDAKVHNFFVRNTFFENVSHYAVRWGTYFPVILGGGLFGSGLIGGSSELASAGGAVLQASLLALCTTTALKALTGRPGPEPVIYDDKEASSVFRFGFLRGGVFHGWPSGHVTANMAAVTSLLSFYDKTWLNIAGGAYLGYLFLSVVSHGRSSMHWFSDAVAGALMGYAIGTTVGRDFRRRWEHKKNVPSALSLNALPGYFSVTFEIAL